VEIDFSKNEQEIKEEQNETFKPGQSVFGACEVIKQRETKNHKGKTD